MPNSHFVYTYCTCSPLKLMYRCAPYQFCLSSKWFYLLSPNMSYYQHVCVYSMHVQLLSAHECMPSSLAFSCDCCLYLRKRWVHSSDLSHTHRHTHCYFQWDSHFNSIVMLELLANYSHTIKIYTTLPIWEQAGGPWEPSVRVVFINNDPVILSGKK